MMMNKHMNKIEKLIDELCPDGVEFRALGEVLGYEQPTKYIVESVKYNDGFNIPVLTAGQSFILGYTDENNGIYKADKENPVIIFDDFTTSFHWVDFNFKVKSSAMKMIRPTRKDLIDFRFLYFAMRCIRYLPQDHARHWISKYSKIKIPIPPLSIQKEIVKILDHFTQLEAELEAELEVRRKQYEYYRDELLSFGDDVEVKALGEVCENCDSKRKPVTKSARRSGKYPYYGASGIVDYVSEYIFDDDYLLVSEDGANLLARKTPIAFPVSGKTWVNNHAHVLKFDNLVTQKYVEIYLNSINLSDYLTGAAQPKLNKGNLNIIKIPTPPLSEQKRIVSILDKFDALVNDISTGLPAEITARKKQYEYYRNRLLTFTPLDAKLSNGVNPLETQDAG